MVGQWLLEARPVALLLGESGGSGRAEAGMREGRRPAAARLAV